MNKPNSTDTVTYILANHDDLIRYISFSKRALGAELEQQVTPEILESPSHNFESLDHVMFT